jgi:hypothetical protein
MKHIKGSRLHLALLVVCVLLAVQCGTDRTVYYLSSTGSDPLAVNWKDSLENVKIYFETSPSMKGYVNLPSVSDSGYIIKRVVPYLITDCQNFPGSVELYTIVISPKRYTQGVDAFNRNLRNGSHMMRSNSELHKIFQVLIENTGPGEISFLITDNIPDLKDGGKNVSLDEITTLIDKVLNENPDISAAVFQFYSEFNGDHYYDQSGSGRPFLNKHITLHHRPLYIWMLGRQELIQMALGEGMPPCPSSFLIISWKAGRDFPTPRIPAFTSLR